MEGGTMRWIFFHGVIGGWGWEQMDDQGQFIAECHHAFETREEAEADARRHGYRPARGAVQEGAEAAPRTVAGTAAGS
jgi:hypothetical protein